MWNSFWVEQLFGSSVRQLADEEGVRAEGGQCGVSWVRAAPRYFNIWFKQRAQSFPSAFLCVLPRCQQQRQQQQQQRQRGCNNDSCIFCISSASASLGLPLARSRTMRTTIPLSARCQRRLSTFSDNQQGVWAGAAGSGNGAGSALKILDMQLPGQLCNWQATDLDEARGCHRSQDQPGPKEGRGAAEGRGTTRLTLILIPATDLPACCLPHAAAKSDRATCVRCSWQFCFALQSLKWVGKRNRIRNWNRNRNIRNAVGSRSEDLRVPISRANSLTYGLFLKHLIRTKREEIERLSVN